MVITCKTSSHLKPDLDHLPYYYAALLPRRGPHIASHSVCLSVCLSVRPELVYIRTSVTCFRQPCGRVVSCFVYMPGPHIVRRSQPHKLVIIINVLIKVTLNEIRCRGTLQSQWSTLTDSTSI